MLPAHGWEVDAAALRLAWVLLQACRQQQQQQQCAPATSSAALVAACGSPLAVVPYPRLLDPRRDAADCISILYVPLVQLCARFGYDASAPVHVALLPSAGSSGQGRTARRGLISARHGPPWPNPG